MLEWPYRQLTAVVVEDFEPQDRSQLRLKMGEQIVIIGKEGYREGWWKAKSKNGVSFFFQIPINFEKTILNSLFVFQIGYFPKYCVREEQEVLHDVPL